MKDALLIIDMQQYIQQRLDQGVGSYPLQAIDQGLALLDIYRQHQRPIIHIFHHDSDPAGALSADKSAALPLDGFRPQPNEKFFIKHHSSAFTDTDLHSHLVQEEITHLTVIGAVTGFCVNSTIRAAADRQFTVTLIEDATVSFDLLGTAFNAEILWATTLALLAADFAQVIPFTQWRLNHENYF